MPVRGDGLPGCPAGSRDATKKRAFRRGEPLKEFQTADSVRLAASTISRDGWAQIIHSVLRLLDLWSHCPARCLSISSCPATSGFLCLILSRLYHAFERGHLLEEC